MANDQEHWTLTARWVFPAARPPLERGTVTIEGDRILAVEPHGERAADFDLGNCAILPGLVNAHTHLDLTGMRGLALPTLDFIGWLRQVIAHRRSRSPEQVRADIEAGLAECLCSGTTLLGDIAAQGTSWPILTEASVRSVVFLELLGLPFDRVREMANAASDWLSSHQATATCRPGLSPHAPYSTHQALFYWAADAARALRIPLATHLAETAAEVELLRDHAGPFLPFLTELGVWNPKGVKRGASHYIRALTPLAKSALLVHCNYLASSTAIPRRAAIIYCPRTHAAFGHPPHPFREFLARGIRVALGTDSLASNPDLDLLAEARFLHSRYPDVPGTVLLRMATLSGAEALNWQDETGSLEPGKSADLVVLPLPNEERTDPHQLVLASSTKVQSVLWRGRWVYPAEGDPSALLHP
jgi:cytosine/adenosine deaminase-related metal-dependent hydrolase